ncbi:MAG: TonB-dependent receptor [Pseudomonadota bacterium]
MGNDLKKKLLASSMLAAMMAAVPFSVANAQEDDVERIAQAGEDEEATLGTIQVTGSRLSQANLVSSSPVATIDSEAFDVRGVTDVIDLVNTLPSAVAAQSSEVSNGATGTSSLNLRGLGTTRTLVLIDGKRLPPGRADSFAGDLNLIPPQLVERAEVVTGGQSAVYGSDAIGGVANFILRRDFEGVEIDGQFGFNQDGNNSDFAQGFVDDFFGPGTAPSGSVTDGEQWDISVLIGANTPDGKGNVTAYARYFEANAILQGDRDIGFCAAVDFGGATCLGSNFGPFPTTLTLPVVFESDAAGDPVQFLANTNADGALQFVDAMGNFIEDIEDAEGNVITPAFLQAVPLLGNMPMFFDDETGEPLSLPRQLPGSAAGTVSLDENGNFMLSALGQGLGATNAFNFNPLNFFQRPSTRYNAGFLGRYQIHDKVEAYFDFGFTENRTDAQIAPSATFGEIQEINCDNPFLTDELVDVICTDRGFGGSDLAPVQINRRVVESGPRNSDIQLTNFRMVGGFRGEIAPGWNYDVFGQFATTRQTDINTEDFNIDLFNEALQVVEDEDGNIVCTSGRDGCIPLNLFGTGPVDLDAVAAIATPTILSGNVTQTVFGGTVTGDLSQYGIASPLASDGIQALFGVEYREEELELQPDAILTIGGATGLGGPEDPTDAMTELFEVFTEVAIPVVQDQPFAKEVSFTGAYRFSTYDSTNFIPTEPEDGGNFDTNAFALGLTWVPVDDLRLRGQFQRAVRAPNVLELFAPQTLQLFNASDPCAGSPPAATAAQCANTGLPANLFGLVPADAGQLQQLGGGNPDLQPEESDTFTVGAIVQPRWVPGLTVSVDYFNIQIDDFINEIPPNTILDQCLDGTNPSFCALINRDALGTLQIDGFIEAVQENIAQFETDGIDINIAYQFNPHEIGYGIPDIGTIALNYVSTVTFALDFTALPGADPTECLGNFGGACDDIVGNPTFDYRHISTATWRSNYDVDLSFTWRYFSPVNNLAGGGDFGVDGAQPEFNNFDAESFFDIYARWQALDGVALDFGVTNLFDADPEISSFVDTANGNTFPSVYDAAGRFIFFGTTINF